MLNNAIDLTLFRIKFTTVGVVDYERWRKSNKFMSVSCVHYSQSTTFVCEKNCVLKISVCIQSKFSTTTNFTILLQLCHVATSK